MAQRKRKAQTLNDLKADLYQIFNQTMIVSDDAGDWLSENDRKKLQEAAPAVIALAETIMGVEHEIAVLDALKEARERGENITIEIDKGLPRNVKPLGPIRLKPGGNP